MATPPPFLAHPPPFFSTLIQSSLPNESLPNFRSALFYRELHPMTNDAADPTVDYLPSLTHCPPPISERVPLPARCRGALHQWPTEKTRRLRIRMSAKELGPAAYSNTRYHAIHVIGSFPVPPRPTQAFSFATIHV